MDTQQPTSDSLAADFTDLSPPSSQNAALPSPHANANGKRPLSSTLDNHVNSPPPMTRSSATPAAREAAETLEIKTHDQSGYTWTRPEDAPGYSWKNKRAMEEAERAWSGILYKDRKVGNRYPDPFEMADNEAAILASRGG